MTTCKKCGQSIFWLQDDNGKWIPFEDDVVIINKVGRKYADGHDEIHISTEEDIDNKVKGFWCHFGRCK